MLTGNERRRIKTLNTRLNQNEKFKTDIATGSLYGKARFQQGVQFGYAIYLRYLDLTLNYKYQEWMKLPAIDQLPWLIPIFNPSRPSRKQLKDPYFMDGVNQILKHLPFIFNEWFALHQFKSIVFDKVDKVFFMKLFLYLPYLKQSIFKHFLDKCMYVTYNLKKEEKEHVPKDVPELEETQNDFKEQFKRYTGIYLDHYMTNLNSMRSKGFYDAKYIFEFYLNNKGLAYAPKTTPVNIDFLFSKEQLSRVRFSDHVTYMPSPTNFLYWRGFFDFFRYAVFLYERYAHYMDIPLSDLPTCVRCLKFPVYPAFTSEHSLINRLNDHGGIYLGKHNGYSRTSFDIPNYYSN